MSRGRATPAEYPIRKRAIQAGWVGPVNRGEGRNAERKVVFGALATVTFDEATSSYRFPAHSDGKFLDTEGIDFPELLEWISEGRPYHDAPRQGRVAGNHGERLQQNAATAVCGDETA